MLDTKQQARSRVQTDPATNLECLNFIRAAIVEADRQTAQDIKNVLAEVCNSGYADRAPIWAALSETEQQQFQELLAPPPVARDFARRIRESSGYNSPAVAGAIQTDLVRAIDAGKVTSAEVVAFVARRNLQSFSGLWLAERVILVLHPKICSRLAPSIEAATKKIS